MRARILSAIAAAAAAAAQTQVSLNLQTAAATVSDTFAPTFGWEMFVMMSYLDQMNDTRYQRAASYLTGSVVRVGGITADWVYYDLAASTNAEHTPVQTSVVPRLGGYWPTAEKNLTFSQFRTLVDFFNATGMRLLFDLNELHGRNCQTVNPITNGSDWCVGEWDTSNVRAFLQAVHDAGLYGPGSPLIGFELGNELITHLDPRNNTQDIITLAGIISSVWAGETPPPLYAPSTDACYTNDTRDIMVNITGAVAGFTYHAYPGGGGTKPPLLALLTNSTWLRTGIMTGSLSSTCIGWWDSYTRPSGMQLWVTESSSSWNWQLPPPAQNAVLHLAFTLAELGQYALTGVGAVARWAFSEPSPFGAIVYNNTQWDAAADYFLLVAYKNVVGRVVLTANDGGGDALVYAHCGQASNGSVVVLAVNPTASALAVSLTDATSGASIAPTPRTEWVFTAPGGNLNSTTPVLNGNEAAPLRLLPDGSMPAMPGAYVPAGGAGITLPPLSQSLLLLTAANAPACSMR